MANLFVRTYTFVDGTTAYGSQVEAEIGNIVTVLNNLNTAATNWGIVSALHATSVPLVADCSSGSQHIADFKNNSVIKASISSDGTITSTKTSNQLALGTTNVITISSTAPSASRTVTIPDPGANADIILSKGTPTMGANLAMGSNKLTGLAAGSSNGDSVRYEQIFYGFQAPVQSTSTTNFTTTSSTFQTTNLTANITPTSSSHRIKITVTGKACSSTAADNCQISIFRGSTDLASSSAGFCAVDGISAAAVFAPVGMSFIDSPATTSSTTYSVKIKNTAGAVTVQFGGGSTTQVMILEEIV